VRFKLTIYPCLDSARDAYTTQFFESRKQVVASKNSCADLLLFLQDKLRVMNDESNIFICEELIDGEWQDMDFEDYE